MTNRREINRILNKIRALESSTTNHYMVYLSLNAEILFAMAGNTSGRPGNTSGRSGNTSGRSGNINGRSGNINGRSGNINGRSGNISGRSGNTPEETENIPVEKKFTSVQGKWVSRRVDIIYGRLERNKKGRYCITGLEKMII